MCGGNNITFCLRKRYLTSNQRRKASFTVSGTSKCYLHSQGVILLSDESLYIVKISNVNSKSLSYKGEPVYNTKKSAHLSHRLPLYTTVTARLRRAGTYSKGGGGIQLLHRWCSRISVLLYAVCCMLAFFTALPESITKLAWMPSEDTYIYLLNCYQVFWSKTEKNYLVLKETRKEREEKRKINWNGCREMGEWGGETK